MEDDVNGDLDAWERTYTGETTRGGGRVCKRTSQDCFGPLTIVALYHSQYRRRLLFLSSTATAARIQKGLIRSLYIVIDLSRVTNMAFLLCVQNANTDSTSA